MVIRRPSNFKVAGSNRKNFKFLIREKHARREMEMKWKVVEVIADGHQEAITRLQRCGIITILPL
jgi:hypothetical protein